MIKYGNHLWRDPEVIFPINPTPAVIKWEKVINLSWKRTRHGSGVKFVNMECGSSGYLLIQKEKIRMSACKALELLDLWEIF